MKFKLVLLTALLFSKVETFAQNARFIFSGSIAYEKKVNYHALLKKDLSTSEYLETYIQAYPQFNVMKSTLTFSQHKMRFDPEKTVYAIGDVFRMPELEQVNIRYTDLSSQTYTSQKTIFGDLFLIRDSVRKINWKFTSETRTIAGYECRRANAIIMDSVYVVAFYTVQIPVFGGPESFSGLPGMILGVALPREHITWFATKVTDRDVSAAEIKPPGQGKVVDKYLIEETVKKALVDDKWNRLQRMLRSVLL